MSSYRKLTSNLWHANAKQVLKSLQLHGAEPCMCLPVEQGGTSCATTQCVNRATKFECDPSRCPCGDACRNQSFQRGTGPKTRLVTFPGKKGQGLVADEPIATGTFIGEYLGEVIDQAELSRRMKEEYKLMTHTYIMCYENSMVLDATVKGGETRFINHSCDPNCHTEKWNVRGLTRVGIFAIRDIQPGEEITYDYNFQKNGHAHVPCECGAAKCRKFLGGRKVVLTRGDLDDSDDEDLAPAAQTRYATDVYGNRTRVQQLDGLVIEGQGGELGPPQPGGPAAAEGAHSGSGGWEPVLLPGQMASLPEATAAPNGSTGGLKRKKSSQEQEHSRKGSKRDKSKSKAPVEHDLRTLDQMLADTWRDCQAGRGRYPSVYDTMQITVDKAPETKAAVEAIESEFAERLAALQGLDAVFKNVHDRKQANLLVASSDGELDQGTPAMQAAS